MVPKSLLTLIKTKKIKQNKIVLLKPSSQLKMMSYLSELQGSFVEVKNFSSDILTLGFISDEYLFWAGKSFYFS